MEMKPLVIAIGGLSAALINNGLRKMHQASQPKYIQVAQLAQLNSQKKRKDK